MKSAHIKIGDQVYLDTFSNEFIFLKEDGQKRVRIEQMTAHLMAVLAANMDSLVSREELIDAVWNGNAGVGNKAVTKNIYKIRKAFEAEGLENPIQTIPKKGYRLSVKASRTIPRRIGKGWLVAAAVVAALVVLNMAMPGFIHEVAEALGH